MTPVPSDPEARLALFGAMMRRRREAREVSLRDAAAALGKTHGWISQIERGLERPGAESVDRICAFLVVPKAERDLWFALADQLPPTLVETLILHPERWADVRRLLTEKA